jgi:tetratricopeptide (TPR) repeat protein
LSGPYAETLQLLSRLPGRRPAASLPFKLDALFHRLGACGPQEAEPIEEEIWSAWMYHGHEEAERALELASRDIAAGRHDIAETRLAILLRRRPDWAEAWNKRATLLYLMERDAESVAAIHRALELEPRHFGALCGLGEILRAHGAVEPALLAFGQALRINPHLGEIRETVRELLQT